MNKNALKKNLYARIRLRPIAKRYEAQTEMESLDDDWIIDWIDDAGVRIRNTRTSHVTTLGYDHIHHFMSDPDRSIHGGLNFGFLIMNVQVHFEGNRLWIEPTTRPGEAI
ncbi:MAG TPA: hypothetical protein VFI02_12555 [Armatimonadota bacterium]|nr:hypothetical protein [Armatimonadota bacterium]